MLSREIMGVIALGILWVNTGLVIVVALKQLRGVLWLRRRWVAARARGELVVGEVRRAGEGERFAVRRIRQHGRAVTSGGPERILFTDGPQSFEVIGGTIATADGELEVGEAQPVQSEVWNDPARNAECVGCGGPAEFDRAYEEASKFKGFVRDVEIEVRTGDRVWVCGRRAEDRLEAPEGEALIVSMIDPIAWASGRVRLLSGFAIGAAVALVAVSGVALWPPHFGLVSTLGGALGLAYFLAIQPLGTAVRDAVNVPARQRVGASWRRPEGASPSPQRA